MKYFLKIAAIVAFPLFFLISCEPDNFECLRDQCLGSWSFMENTAAKNVKFQSYTVKITKNVTDSTLVWLENFGNPNDNCIKVSGTMTSNGISIPYQKMSNGWWVKGEGVCDGSSKMTWNYEITLAGDVEYFVATASKL